MFKSTSYDVQIVQQGDIYSVSGKDAQLLHAKLQSVPAESRALEVGALDNGTFTLKKITAGGAYSEPTTTAKAG